MYIHTYNALFDYIMEFNASIVFNCGQGDEEGWYYDGTRIGQWTAHQRALFALICFININRSGPSIKFQWILGVIPGNANPGEQGINL